MCSAGSGIGLGADAGANNPARAVDEIAINARTMIRIFFENGEMTSGCAVSGLAGRDRTVSRDFLANHQIGALPGNRNANVHIVRRCLFEHGLIYLQRGLAANVGGRAAHLSRLRCGPW